MGSNGNGNGQPDPATNLTYTKFVFVLPYHEDAATQTKIRTAGSHISRGFYNDYDADGSRDVQPQETIQFLTAESAAPGRDGIGAARYVVHLSGNYRPRLQEVACELKRRVSGAADIIILDGAERTPRYTSAEMRAFAYKRALARQSGRVACNAIVMPMSKTAEWWEKTALERHSYFYPHHEGSSHSPVKGHAKAAESGIRKVFRRLYHNPDGYQRENEFDFITYFECTDENIPVFDHICHALRDKHQNPEWKYVLEGPEWRGKRVMRW
ncbi:MAG: hypothetical protein EHM55_00845 [Acidobacteria bacterium]|nr:MAG: hypothetical protein EHM55_00845 [Acidobacteriota bacterium]